MIKPPLDDIFDYAIFFSEPYNIRYSKYCNAILKVQIPQYATKATYSPVATASSPDLGASTTPSAFPKGLYFMVPNAIQPYN
jgi:hypothetical protein